MTDNFTVWQKFCFCNAMHMSIHMLPNISQCINLRAHTHAYEHMHTLDFNPYQLMGSQRLGRSYRRRRDWYRS